MKYVKPVAEIKRLSAVDILTASTETETTTKKSQPGTVVGDDGGICSYTKADNYNMNNCL